MSLRDTLITLNISNIINGKCVKYLIENREKFSSEEMLYIAAELNENFTEFGNILFVFTVLFFCQAII